MSTEYTKKPSTCMGNYLWNNLFENTFTKTNFSDTIKIPVQFMIVIIMLKINKRFEN